MVEIGAGLDGAAASESDCWMKVRTPRTPPASTITIAALTIGVIIVYTCSAPTSGRFLPGTCERRPASTHKQPAATTTTSTQEVAFTMLRGVADGHCTVG